MKWHKSLIVLVTLILGLNGVNELSYAEPVKSLLSDIPLFQEPSVINFWLTLKKPSLATEFALAESTTGNLVYRYQNRTYKMPISIEQRGVSRRGNDFKPLKIKRSYKNKGKHYSPLFEHAKKSTKIVTQDKLTIGKSEEISERTNTGVKREHAIYNMMEAAGIVHFKTRLAHIEYKDSAYKTFEKGHAIFLEHQSDVAKRYQSKSVKLNKVSAKKLNLLETIRLTLVEEMIANRDFDILDPKNIKLIQQSKKLGSKIIPVPYDFDRSGFITNYLPKPSLTFSYESLRDEFKRYYSEDDFNKAWITAALDIYDRKREIESAFGAVTFVDPGKAQNYLDQYFEVLKSSIDQLSNNQKSNEDSTVIQTSSQVF